MKPIQTTLIALATLILGGFAGYFFGHNDPEPSPTPAPFAEAGNIEPDPSPSLDVVPVLSPVSRNATPVANPVDNVAQPKVGSARGAAAALIAAVADERPLPGDGRLHGVVTGPAGDPVAGATVTITARYPREKMQYDPNDSFEMRLEKEARRQSFYENGKLTAQSNAAGAYEFTNLGDYDFSVECKFPGLRFDTSGDITRGRDARPPAEVNFRGTAVCEIEFDIRLPDGTQPANATVWTTTRNSRSGMGWAPSRPSIQLQPGTYTMSVTSGEFEEFASEASEYEAKAGPVLKMTVNLAALGSIVCRVKMPEGTTGPEGFPGRGAKVLLQSNPPAGAPTEIPRGENVRTTEEYGFRGEEKFGRLPAGNYRLILTQGTRILAWKDVTVATGVVRETLAPPEPEASNYLIVKVLYADGKPATGGLRAEYVSDSREPREMWRGRGAMATVLSRPGGVYWVEKPQAGDAILKSSWRYRLSGNAPEYGAYTREHPGDGAAELTINLPAPAFLTVYYTGASTHPQKSRLEAQLFLSDSGNGWTGVNGSDRAVKDSVRYGPLAPGTYRLTLRVGSGRRDIEMEAPMPVFGDSELLSLNFEVAPGENTQTCVVPLICKLALLIEDPKKVQMLQIGRADGSGTRHLMGAQITERTVIEGLAAGEWVITSRNEGMRINLTGDMEVTFSPKAFDCVVVVGLKSGGKIEGLGLRSGDKVIRVDGEDGATGADIQRLIGASYSKETTTWTVQRAGATLNVTFNGKELQSIMAGRGAERENFSTRHSMRD